MTSLPSAIHPNPQDVYVADDVIVVDAKDAQSILDEKPSRYHDY